jgi:hypothetical protein
MNQSTKDVTFTPDFMHIPNLRKKLKWLYSRHPSIKKQGDCARALEVPASSLSDWLNGIRRFAGDFTSGINPDSIPVKKYRSFIELWGVPEEILHIEDVIAFRKELARYDGEPSPWGDLIAALPDDSSIEIVKHATRGLSNPDIEADPDLLTLRTGDEIMLRVANPGKRHATLLLHDRYGWSCLRPTANRPETNAEESVVFPRQADQGLPIFSKVQDPTGLHRILAIFTRQPLAIETLNALRQPTIDSRNLDQVAGNIRQLLSASPEECRLISRRFLVSH